MNEFSDFLLYSRRLGKDPSLIQGAGGNSSIKIGGKLFVKASGVIMKNLTEGGLVKCDYKRLNRYLLKQKSYSSQKEKEFSRLVLQSFNGQIGTQPSIETGLHAALTSTYIFHTHNVYSNIFNCLRGGQKILGQIFGQNFACVSYKNPGTELALELSKRQKLPALIFLQNHGLITHGQNVNKTYDLTSHVSKKIISYLKSKKVFLPFKISKRGFDFKRHLFPDSVVYGQINFAMLPPLKKQVYFEIVSVSRYILNIIKKLKGKPTFLTPVKVKFITDMEQEKYRINLFTKS